MKVDVRSMWDTAKHRPNIWFSFKPENDVEVALMQSLYSVKPKFVEQTSGEHLLDFYPAGEKRGK